jgi:kynurenine formamidase
MSTNKTLTDFAAALVSGSIKVVDLSAPLGPETPVLYLPPEIGKNTPAVKVHEISHYDQNGPFWAWNWLELGEHTGTHFDAPVHWITGRALPANSTDTIPPQRLVAPACVIDAEADCAKDPGFLLTRARLLAWEEAHGRIPAGAWVLLRSGWSRRSGAAFLNNGPTGPESPGPDVECVKFMVQERDVIGFGTETVGTDAGRAHGFDPPFPCHSFMHGANKFGLASLTNLDQLPPTGSLLITPPLKIAGGSGSPCRVLALVAG